MTKALQRHKNRVAALGCILCKHLGDEGTPAELHHPREEVGMGQRENDWLIIPLCSYHHRLGKYSVHGLGRRAFELHFSLTELDLLAMTIEALHK